jgi:tape measure domain-containing protein
MAVEIKVTSDSRQAQTDLRKLENSLKAVEQSTVQINSSLAKTANLAKVAFATLPLAFVATKAISTAASFEKLAARLDVVTGSAVRTAQAFAGVQKLVKETPFGVQALTDGYARLAATGSRLFRSQKDIERGLVAIANATAAVGGSNLEFRRVATAFERASSEGRITAERLNQLVDVGIPLTRVADRLGLSMEELRKETEKGNFSFERFYQAFVDVAEAADGFGGAASRQVNTLNGAFSNLNDALDILSDKIVRQSGLSRILVSAIVGITNAINSFSENIDVSLLIALNRIEFFTYDVKYYFDIIKSVFQSITNTVVDFIPEFNFDLADIQFQFKQALGKINISGYVTPYAITLADWMPGLDSVMTAIYDFGKFIKDVFFDIYDAVVGNSYWPDMIDGVVNLAAGLLNRVKPHFDAFKAYVNQIFLDLKDTFNTLFKDIEVRIQASSETGSIKQIAGFLERIDKSFESLVKKVKEYPAIEKAITAIETFLETIKESTKDIKPEVWLAMSSAFHAINLFANQGLGRLLAAVGLTEDAKKVEELTNGQAGTGVAEAARRLGEQVSKGASDLEKGAKNAGTSIVEAQKEGLAFSEQLQAVYNSFGGFIGRVLARVFNDASFEPSDNLTDLFYTAILAALSRPFRNLLVISAALSLFVIGENSISDVLAKVYDSISDFGNSILKGAGITGFETGLGGFVAGLLFGGLALATVTGKLVPILASIAKFFGAQFILRRIINPDDQAQAEAAALTAGQKLAGNFRKGFTLAGAGIGLIVGATLSQEIVSAFNITDPVTKVFLDLGITAATAFIGALAGKLLAGLGIKIAAVIGTAILGVISIPAILAALGITAIGGLLAYIFFGKSGESSEFEKGMGRLWESVKTKYLAPIGKYASLQFEKLVTSIVQLFKDANQAFSDAITNITLYISKTIKDTITAITNGINNYIAYFKLFWSTVFTIAKTGWDNIKTVTVAFWGSMADIVRAAFSSAFSFIGERIRGFASSVRSYLFDAPENQPSNFDTPPGFATGGRIRGPGSGTSDSILARVSNGEYVVNAAATRNNLDLLEAINSGKQLPAFKDGGGINLESYLSGTNQSFQDLVSLKEAAEGRKSRPYNDSKNLPTIGIGHLITRRDLSSGSFLKDRLDPVLRSQATKLSTSELSKQLNANGPINNSLADRSFKSLSNVEIDSLFQSDFESKLGDVAKNKTLRDIWLDGNSSLKKILPDLVFNMGLNTLLNFKNTINSLKEKDYESAAGFLRDSKYFFQVGTRAWDHFKSILLMGGEQSSSYIPPKPKLASFTTSSDTKFNLLRTFGIPISGIANNSKLTGKLNFEDYPGIKSVIANNYSNLGFSFDSKTDTLIKKTGKSIQKFATGGRISGPGSGTSDSILARLSNGEFVVNAKATRNNLPLLESINSGALPKFNTGGLVDPLTAQASALGLSLGNVDFSKATNSQRLSLEKLLRDLKLAYEKSEQVFLREGKLSIEAVERTTKAIAERVAPFVQKTAEELAAEKGDRFRGTAKETAEGFRGDVRTNFSELLKGKTDINTFATKLADSFTSRVIDSFSNQLIDSLFESGNLNELFTSIFEGQAKQGDAIGEKLGTVTKPFAKDLEEIFSRDSSFIGSLSNIFNSGISGFSSIFSSIAGGLGGIGKSILGFFGFANGGYVSGPGTSTSDSIPAMLSNGEYVINAKSTAKMRPLLEAINSGSMPKFADGGIVGDVSSLTSAGVGSVPSTQQSSQSMQQVINVNITGDISRQTQSEIYKMLPQIANGVNGYNKEKGFR